MAAVVLLAEARDRLLEQRLRLRVGSRLAGGLGCPHEQVGSFRVAGRGERERLRVVRLGCGDVEREGAVAGDGQGAPCGPVESRRLNGLAGGEEELPGLRVVVGEHLGEVLDPLRCLALDPSRRRLVLRRPADPRDLAVGDVADEHVPEAVLGLAGHRALPGRPDELRPGELVQAGADRLLVAVADRRERACPEDLADNGGVLKQGLALLRECVQAGGDQRLQVVGEGDLGAFAQLELSALAHEQLAVLEHAHELLRIERVAAGALQDERLHLRRQQRLVEQDGDEPGRLGLGKGRESDSGRVTHPGEPVRRALVQLGAGGADKEHRHPLRPFDDVLEKGEQRLLGPVQVLEDEDGRTRCGDRLQEAPPGGERLLSRG